MTEFDPIESQFCPLWHVPANVVPVQNYDQIEVLSPRAGGLYRITRSADINMRRDIHSGLNAKLTTWLFEQRNSGILTPLITTQIIELALQRNFISYSQKIENFFKFIEHQYPSINFIYKIGDQNEVTNERQLLCAAIEARDLNFYELQEFLRLLQKREFIKMPLMENEFRLEHKGWEYLDELSKKRNLSDKAFVAMWFDPSLNEVFNEHIGPALTECGYSSPFRIDQHEHSDKIDDAIIAKINEASLVIVDLTCDVFNHSTLTERKIVEARGGVYFEAGYAMGLGIPIIWTCRTDCIKHIHFDLRQYRQIGWYEEEGTYNVKGLNDKITFKEALVNRISALRLNRNGG